MHSWDEVCHQQTGILCHSQRYAYALARSSRLEPRHRGLRPAVGGACSGGECTDSDMVAGMLTIPGAHHMYLQCVLLRVCAGAPVHVGTLCADADLGAALRLNRGSSKQAQLYHLYIPGTYPTTGILALPLVRAVTVHVAGSVDKSSDC